MQIYEEITPQEREEEQRAEILPRQKKHLSWVMLQAVVCVILLAAALVLRSLLPNLYKELRANYDAEMERSILITQDDISDP